METRLLTMRKELALLLVHLEHSVKAGAVIFDSLASLKEHNIKPEQLKTVRLLEQELETLQDQASIKYVNCLR